VSTAQGRSATPGGSGFGNVLSLVQGVEGWLTDAQARRLWDSAAALRAPGRIVEIGSFRGRSTIVLASAAVEGVELVAVDPHGGGDRGPQEITPDAEQGEQDFVAFGANLRRAGVEGRVRHLRAPSLVALGEVDGPVDLLYVDGAHRYRPARDDIERWGARVAPGGSMLVHDAFNAIGVTLAQLRLLLFSTQWRYRGRRGSLAEYRREPLHTTGVTINALRQLAGLPYFVRNMLVKVALLARLAPLARLLGHRDGDWPY
jgi:predicted O-methyltransferase YrrM